MERPVCDKCGRYLNPKAHGVSWSQSYSGYDLHDPSFRCSPCTVKHGVKESNCNPQFGPWSGRNPVAALEQGDKT